MATVVASAGFDWGSLAGISTGNAGSRVFDGSGGTLGTDVQILTAASRLPGGYGLRCNLATPGFLFWDTSTLGAGGTILVVSTYFRLSTAPSANTDLIAIDTAALADDITFFRDNTTGRLVCYLRGNSVNGPVISSNTWYRLDFRLSTAATHVMDWQVDGVTQTQNTFAIGASTITKLCISSQAAGSGVADFDDVVVSTTSGDYPFGPHKNILLTVDPADTVTVAGATTDFQTFTANGTLTAWNATTARDAVDEVPPTVGASADGLAQVLTATTNYVELPMTSYQFGSGEAPVSLELLAVGWAATTTAATFGFRSWNGAAETVLQAGTVDPNFSASTTAPAWVCKMCAPADFDTQTELDSLAFRVGFSSDASPQVGVHAVYAELVVDVNPAPRQIQVINQAAISRAGRW